MDEKTFIKNTASICEMLLKNAAHSFGIDFSVLNETLIEIEKRAHELGLTRKDLYPNEKY
jgi:hypothetical protein